MNVIGLMLILAAGGLLVLGLGSGSSQLLVGSVGSSLLAAMALVVGFRQLAAQPVDGVRTDAGDTVMIDDAGIDIGTTEIDAGNDVAEGDDAEGDGDDIGENEDDEVPGEPPPQQVAGAEAARIAEMSTEVLVVDGRPRYHLAACARLLGRVSVPLPVSEAVELGFTPCGLCEPAASLLAESRFS